MRLKDKIVSDISFYSLSMYCSQVLQVVRGFVVAKMLGPTLMGHWGAVLIIFTYGGSLHLGTLHGMNKLVPYLRGRREENAAEELKNVAYTTTMAASFVLVLVLIVLELVGWTASSPIDRTGILLMGAVVLIYQHYNFHLAVARMRHEFKLASNANIFFSLLNTVLTIALIYFYKIYGAFVAFLVSYIITAWYVARFAPERFRWQWRFSKLVTLVKTGIPIEVVGMVYTLLMTVDKLMILKYLTKTELGLYGLALTINGMIYFVPTAASSVLFPRLLEKYGERQDAQQLKNLLHPPTMVLAYMMPLMIGVIHLIIPPVVQTLLPQFAESLKAIKILLWGAFCLSLLQIASSYLIARNKERQMIIAQAVAVLISIVLNYVFIKSGWGIAGVAWGTAIVYFLYASTLLVLAYRDHAPTMLATVIEVGKLYLPLLYGLAVIWILDQLGSSREIVSLWNWVVTAGKIIIFVTFSIPLLFFLNRRTEVMLTLWRLIKRRFNLQPA